MQETACALSKRMVDVLHEGVLGRARDGQLVGGGDIEANASPAEM